MKKSKKRLILHRETIQTLSHSLSKVAGATDPSCPGPTCHKTCFNCPNFPENPDTRTFIGCA